MRSRYLVVLISIFFIGVNSRAESISLDEFLQIVAANHPLFEGESLKPEIEASARNRYLTGQDWLLQASPSYFHAKPVVTSPFSPTTIDEIDLMASMERSFWNTGGRLSLDWQSRLTEQSFPAFDFSVGASRLYTNRIGIGYTQPLLKNRGGTLDRLEYDLAGYDIKTADLEARENQEKFLLETALQFVDWVLLEEKKVIAEDRLTLAETELERIKEKREANLVDQVDVLRAEDAVRVARQNLVLIEAERKAQQAELSVTAQMPDLVNISPVFNIYGTVDIPAMEDIEQVLESSSRALRLLELNRKQLEKLQEGYAETSRPTLNAVVGMGLTGGNEDFDNALEITQPDFRLGLVLTHPLGSRAAKIDMNTNRLQIRQLEMRKKQALLALVSAFTGLQIQIRDLAEVLELNRQEIESARLKTREEQKLYNQGRGDLTFVIQSQDNEQNARLTYAENAARYQGLILRYREVLDQILKE